MFMKIVLNNILLGHILFQVIANVVKYGFEQYCYQSGTISILLQARLFWHELYSKIHHHFLQNYKVMFFTTTITVCINTLVHRHY